MTGPDDHLPRGDDTGDDTYVDDAALRDCVRAVLALYDGIDGQFRIPTDGQVKFQATFPLAMYALNQAHATLLLTDSGRPYLAVANVRVAYEHAVTAAWVLHTPGAEQRLIGTVNSHTRNVIAALADHTAIPDVLNTGFGEDGDPTMPNFRARADALDATGSVHFYYRVLTEAIHPSIATVTQHLAFTGEHVTGISFAANHAPPPDTWTACALASLAAATVIEIQRENRPRMPQLLELSERYRIPLDLRTTATDI